MAPRRTILVHLYATGSQGDIRPSPSHPAMSPTSRWFNFLSAALASTLSTTSATTSHVSDFPEQSSCPPVLTASKPSAVQWGPCDPSIVENPVVSCCSFEVPLDYNDTSVGTAKLALAKMNATLEPRLGTVFFNPGTCPSFVSHSSSLTPDTRRPG